MKTASETKSETERIQIIVKAALNYLDMTELKLEAHSVE